MASLLIRNVDPDLHARLRARAAAHHRSMEEEARALLRTGLAGQDTQTGPVHPLALASQLFGAENGIDLPLPPRDRTRDRLPPDFS